jgi:hypothetical protein
LPVLFAVPLDQYNHSDLLGIFTVSPHYAVVVDKTY